jgi:alanine racemase
VEATRRCWAEISLRALRHNLRVVREKIGPGVQVMAIVKADAYGHGVGEISRALNENVEMFGVANLQEALQLNESLGGHAAARIFILGPALPGERELIVRNGFLPSISTLEEARHYAQLAKGGELRVHLVIDTGMGRTGVWQEETLDVFHELRRLGNLRITGIKSHLPVADEDEEFTEKQLRQFEHLVRELREAGCDAPLVHALNSAGIIGFSKHAGGLVRAGLMLYGSSPIAEFQRALQPVMTWKTAVTLVREVGPGRGISYGRTFITDRAMRIATLAAGYADGYQRHLSGRGAEVLIDGKRCKILGRITMDQIMADVSEVTNVQPGDEAVLMGRQGEEEILASELAAKSGTIAWEIFTSVSSRVERVYLPSSPDLPGAAA